MKPEFQIVSRDTDEFGAIDLNVAIVGPDDGPLMLCVHGWPEIWHSWRFQMDHFAELGYRVAAMDVRGYGGSSRPKPIEAYRLTELCADTAAVVEALSPDDPAILLGHDWGAPIVWNTARLHPGVVRAVAGLSVPYHPASAGDPMELWNAVYENRFFYMKYFQEPGVAEAAFEADLGAAIRKVYYAAGGESTLDLWLADRPDGYEFLTDLIDPDPAPAWMSPEAIQITIDAHAAGGMHGAFNRYRAQALDAEIETMGNPILPQATCFIGGEFDVVRHFVPGVDVYENAGAACSDFRGTTVIDDAGHWVQQQFPDEVNAALERFVDSLDR